MSPLLVVGALALVVLTLIVLVWLEPCDCDDREIPRKWL